MRNIDELKDYIENGHKYYLREFTVEFVIFGYSNRKLKVLIGKWNGFDDWGLPTGLVRKEEPLTAAAARILYERTTLENIYLKQFNVFGDSNVRLVPGGHAINKKLPEDSWLLRRTLSIGYYALIEHTMIDPKPDFFIEKYKWQDAGDVPQLLADHNEIFASAIKTLRQQIYYMPIGYSLLPEKFTLPEIQSLYETILDRKLDRRNFTRRLMLLGIIKKLDEKKMIGQHRAPFLYSFDKAKYDEALENGIVLSF